MASPQLHEILPRIWILESLAQSKLIDVILLLDLLKDIPKEFDSISENARELVCLRVLESLLLKEARENPESSSTSSQRLKLDPSERCEHVVKQIYAPRKHFNQPDISKWDLRSFVEHKRSNLGKSTLQKLKEAIVSGRSSLDAFLKEQSALGFSATVSVSRNETNENSLLERYLQDEKLLHAERKRKAVDKSSGENYEGIEMNGSEVKKRKHQDEGLCDLRMVNDSQNSHRSDFQNDNRDGEDLSAEESDIGQNRSTLCDNGKSFKTGRIFIGDDEPCDNPGDSRGNADFTSCHVDVVDELKKIYFSSRGAVMEGRNICVECRKGGELLVCSSSSCSLVIHECCLGTKAVGFEAGGNFYCPFCAYSRAVERVNKTKEKSFFARTDLKNFFDYKGKSVIRNIAEQANVNRDKGSAYAAATEILRKADDGDPGKAHGRRACSNIGESSKECGNMMNSASQSHQDFNGNRHINELMNHIHGEDGQSSVSTSEDLEEKNRDGFRMVVKHNSSLTPRKGDRNWWTPAEVEALVEGVKAYFHPNQSSIPWKLVLAFGTGRFNPSRTVADLKDKWRNINKERSKRATKGKLF